MQIKGENGQKDIRCKKGLILIRMALFSLIDFTIKDTV